MEHPSSPLGSQLEQEFPLLIAFEGGARTTTGPPMHGGQFGGIALLVASHQDHCQPMQTRHENGTARRRVVALFDVSEPGSFAGAHRAILFGREAFGLLPHTLIPDGKAHPAPRFSRRSTGLSPE